MSRTFDTIHENAVFIAGGLALMWAIEIVNLLLDHRLNVYGLLPRASSGLWGILSSPLLHGSPRHLALNSTALAVLAVLVALHGRRVLVEVTAFAWLVGGALLWLVGRPVIHVGASGLVYGYLGYLVTMGWFARSLRAVALAVVAVLLYGGLARGILPTDATVSWEGHLCGLVAGALGAWMSTPQSSRRG